MMHTLQRRCFNSYAKASNGDVLRNKFSFMVQMTKIESNRQLVSSLVCLFKFKIVLMIDKSNLKKCFTLPGY